jgi:uncharacterized protein
MSQLTCPTCGQSFDSADSPAMPFCSSRCRTVDLGRWLKESQGLPAPRRDPEDDEEPPPGEAD